MKAFLDIASDHLNKQGEELCGDKVKVLKTGDRAILVLSDGLGSGVKANILATLTSEILATMLAADVSLEDTIPTVIATLPICQVRGVAYATFTIAEINQQTHRYRIMNFDNPPYFHFRGGHLDVPAPRLIEIHGHKIRTAEGTLEQGDYLCFLSDGVIHAGMGEEHNLGWGWESVGKYMEDRLLIQARNARDLVRDVLGKTSALYRGNVRDDATALAVHVRDRQVLTVLTGPPLVDTDDEKITQRLFQAEGRKVVCGGTTAKIVARSANVPLRTLYESMRPDIPPVGQMEGIDLVTEGIFTLLKTLEILKEAHGEAAQLPTDENGAVLLARELLRADEILFIVGQCINEYYQNPLLPRTISIRKTLVTELAALLTSFRKETRIEYC
jgi:hypothetical protein